ncbi:MAG: hypothetical protein V4760_01470 [Bdellovibrionota bacterium]
MYQRRYAPQSRPRPPESSGGLLFLASIFAVVGSLLVGYVALEKMTELRIVVGLDQAARQMAEKVDFKYRNVRVSLWERAIRINGISLKAPNERDALRIDRVTVSELDWETIFRVAQTGGAPTIPRTIRMGVHGVHLTPRMLGAKPASFMKQLGYDEISLSLSTGFLFDRRKNIFGVDGMTIEVADMGRLKFSFQLGNVRMPTDGELLALKTNPDGPKPEPPDMKDATLRSAEISYHDLSLLGRIDQMLKNEGKPGLADLVQIGTRMPASAGGQFIADAVEKVNKFVSAPEQSIRISSQPLEPLPLDSLGLEVLLGPDKLAKKLNLQIDVN